MDIKRFIATAVALSLSLLAAVAVPASADEAPPSPEVKYKAGSGFTLVQGDNFTLQVQGRIQARYTYMDYDADRDITDSSNFTAERVRLGAKGSFFKVWSYDMEADFGKGRAELKKGLISWSRVPEAKISMGQMNVKFDRSQYLSSAKQQFVDRSLAASTFGQEYDIGLDVSGAAFDSKFQYSAGVFNGEKAAPGVANKKDGHLLAARVSFNPNGDFGMSESDIKKTADHLWFIDAGARRRTARPRPWPEDPDGHLVAPGRGSGRRFLGSPHPHPAPNGVLARRVSVAAERPRGRRGQRERARIVGRLEGVAAALRVEALEEHGLQADINREPARDARGADAQEHAIGVGQQWIGRANGHG